MEVPIDTGDTAWMMVATGLVLLMTPALGFFEAGLIRGKNSLSVMMQTFRSSNSFYAVVPDRIHIGIFPLNRWNYWWIAMGFL